MRENDAPWNERVCSRAAENGYFELLEWLRVNGAPWDEEVCTHAARRGDLELLKWARANGALGMRMYALTQRKWAISSY